LLVSIHGEFVTGYSFATRNVIENSHSSAAMQPQPEVAQPCGLPNTPGHEADIPPAQPEF
jgi:hypothetical protein